MKPLEYRADVPPSLHPNALANEVKILHVSGTIGAWAIWHAREGMGAVYNTFAAIEDAEKSLIAAADKGATKFDSGRVHIVHGREAELVKAATIAYERACTTINSHRGYLEKQRDTLIEGTSQKCAPVNVEQSKAVDRVLAQLDAAAEQLTQRWIKSQNVFNQVQAKATAKASWASSWGRS